MYPAIVVGIAVFVSIVVMRSIAIRRAASGDHRLDGFVYTPGLLGGVAVMWAGVRVAGPSLAVGLILITIGGITTVLVGRLMLQGPSAARRQLWNGELAGPYFDYIIWVALGVPVVFVVVLAIMAITGGLASS